MPEQIRIEIPGLKETVNLMKGDDLYAEPLRDGMKQLGELGRDFAIVAAPMASGQTIAKMSSKVQAKPVPAYVVIKTTARNPRNKVAYPRILEYTHKWKHFGWFKDAITSSEKAWGPILEKIGQAIGRKWSN